MELTDQVLAVVRRYADRKITRSRAASILKCSERQVTRLMAELSLDRVVSATAKVHAEAAKKRLAREQAARAVINSGLSHEQAALRAGCSPRTIYRYVERLSAAKKKKKR